MISFSDLIGSQKTSSHLKSLVDNSRLGHAYFFNGKQGCESLMLAVAFCRYISCKQKQNDACGKCGSCLKFDKLAHPDLHFSFPIILAKDKKTSDDYLPQWRESLSSTPYITTDNWINVIGEGNKQGVIGTAESENIVKKLALKSYEGGYKFLILWSPETMNISAANKLLKLIEEPPPKTLIIMVGSHTEVILPTIMSRTQLVKIPNPSEQDIAQLLIKKTQVSEQEAQRISLLAGQNIFKALQLIEKEKTENDNFEYFTQWMRLCFKKDILQLLNWVENMASIGREKQKQFLNYSLGIIRNSILKNYQATELIRLPDEETGFIQNFSPYISNHNVPTIFEAFDNATAHIERNANPKILFLDLSFTMLKSFKRK